MTPAIDGNSRRSDRAEYDAQLSEALARLLVAAFRRDAERAAAPPSAEQQPRSAA